MSEFSWLLGWWVSLLSILGCLVWTAWDGYQRIRRGDYAAALVNLAAIVACGVLLRDGIRRYRACPGCPECQEEVGILD